MLSDTSPVEPLTCTVKYAAQLLGISNESVYTLLDKGAISSGYTPVGRRLVHMDSLREFVANLPKEDPRKDGAA